MNNTLLQAAPDTLPTPLAVFLAKGTPIPPSVKDRYFAHVPAALNMAKLLTGIYLIAAFFSTCLALTIYHKDELMNLAILAFGILLFTLFMVQSRRHKAAGGNLEHLGAFVLESGILFWDGKSADFIAREAIVGFETDAVDGEYKQTYLYPVYQEGSVSHTYRRWGFPTVGLTAKLHKEMLEHYTDTGTFSLDAYLHVSRDEAHPTQPSA